MERNNLSTFEKTRAKREALDKLDLLIEAELKRLYGISPDEPILEKFEVCIDKHNFSAMELGEIKSNIAILRKLSSNNAEERKEATDWLSVALQFRAIAWPW